MELVRGAQQRLVLQADVVAELERDAELRAMQVDILKEEVRNVVGYVVLLFYFILF